MNKRHSRVTQLSVLLMATVLLVSGGPLLCAAEPATAATTSSAPPLQAALIGPLDATRLKVGAAFRVRVTEAWKDEDCQLKPGAIVQGRVVHVAKRSKVEKISQMQLSFTAAECGAPQAKPLALTFIALVGAYGEDRAPNGSGLAEAPPLADLPGLAIGTSTAPTREAPSEFRSVSDASAINDFSQSIRQTRKLPSQILPGQVIDAPRMELHVAAGDQGATIVAAIRGDARIEPGSTLIMVATDRLKPRDELPVLRANSAEGRAPPPAVEIDAHGADALLSIPAIKDAPDESEICTAECIKLSTLEGVPSQSSRSLATLSLRSLGYAPHGKERALSFNHETTLTYLDEHHLLCTFDPHRLRLRSKDGTEAIRTIRAVMIDPASRKVQRVMEWRVRGDDAYLWRYGSNMVLVHVEHALRLFDSELKVVRSIPVEGPVAWVVTSPSTDHTAVGVLKRRYSLDTVREMENAGEKIDEDLQVSVYDSLWNLISAAVRSPGFQPPVLSDAGELRVQKVSSGKWKIVEYSWERRERTLATVHSICRPLFSAQEHGLTFVTGCMGTSGNVWYRMLRSDGRPLLKAESASDEIAQMADAATSGSFAIRVVKASRPMSVDQPYSRADLLQENISIFRSPDGKQMGSVTTDDFVVAQNSFALSPSGSQMAVVGNDSIRFYDIANHR